jgi:transposase-like protein
LESGQLCSGNTFAGDWRTQANVPILQIEIPPSSSPALPNSLGSITDWHSRPLENYLSPRLDGLSTSSRSHGRGPGQRHVVCTAPGLTVAGHRAIFGLEIKKPTAGVSLLEVFNDLEARGGQGLLVLLR